MSRAIMLVDDEVLVMKTLEKVFKKADYEVVGVTNGQEALSLLDSKDIRVFLLDLNMPGMTGVDLCRKIKEKYPVSCVYALTGYANEFHLAECREVGFDDYFTKPFKVDQMLKVAEEAFEKLKRWEYQEQMSGKSK